jgi:hypothetical protein
MVGRDGDVIVGVLGQWASGKSTAVSTLVEYLGGEEEVMVLNDAVFFGEQAIDHVLEQCDSTAKLTIEDDGSQRWEGECATVWLAPGQGWETIDAVNLRYKVSDDVMPAWLDNARIELGNQIRQRAGGGRPVVVEAGFGEYPHGHGIAELLSRLEEVGVQPGAVKWIIVEACFEKRAERNERRPFGPPGDMFSKYASDGGDLDPDAQQRLEERGAVISRVSNDHDDVMRFRNDIVAAVERMLAVGN